MQRYSIDHHTGPLYSHSNGHIVLYSDAMDYQKSMNDIYLADMKEKDVEIDLLKGELELSKQEVFTKDQVIAELKAEIDKYHEREIQHLQEIASRLPDKAKLSHLTAALNDNERAEKVAMKDTWNEDFYERNLRRRAINDYRAMLKENSHERRQKEEAKTANPPAPEP